MVIGRDIVERCTEEASEYRLLPSEGSAASSPRTPPSSSRNRKGNTKSLSPKPQRSRGCESGYATDSDRSEDYIYSPATSSGSAWTAMNTPRSAAIPRYQPLTPDHTPSSILSQLKYTTRPLGSVSSQESRPAKRLRPDDESDVEDDSSSTQSSHDTPMMDVEANREFSGLQEARAAYQLIQLHMDDAAQEGNRMRRRRAST